MKIHKVIFEKVNTLNKSIKAFRYFYNLKFENKNTPIEIDDKTLWISRSISITCFIFVMYKGELCVIANQRGIGTPDFRGYWNAPCGFLDYNESLETCCTREVFEETGLIIFEEDLSVYGINSNPYMSNNQNVTVRYFTTLKHFDESMLSDMNSEENEVADLKAIPVSDLDKYKWAFRHNIIIEEILNKKSQTILNNLEE
jgi:ADP-ribose pyrophosphatase YjhB (NUDIX family)